MHADQLAQHFNLPPNFELRKQRHYPIIPTGMRYNILYTMYFVFYLYFSLIAAYLAY